MRAARQRWALSFADLCLLLLGFVLILQTRPDAPRLAAGMRAALGAQAEIASARAADLFEPGEAILGARGRAFAARFATGAAGGAILVESRGIDRGATRFDGWELAAARAAALARGLVAAGVAERRITLSVEGASAPGQRLSLRAG